MDSPSYREAAVPLYLKLAEVASMDSKKNDPVLLTAYEFLGAYEANITKNYIASIFFYGKLIKLNLADGMQ